MKRTMKDTKVCGQMSSNETLFDDSWFNGVKTEEQANSEILHYCEPAKTSHKVYLLSKLKN